MRFAPLLFALACNATPSDPTDTDTGSASDTELVIPPQQYYRLLEMSGPGGSVTYEDQTIDGGAGPIPQRARGYLYLDEDALHMDLRMTVINDRNTNGVITGESSFAYEDDGAKIVLIGDKTWVYHVTRDGPLITLAIATDDPRNQASQSSLDTYTFTLEAPPTVPFVGSWQLEERTTTQGLQTPTCGLALDAGFMKLYGTADGVSTFNAQGGLEYTLNLFMWDNNTCADAPMMDLQMYGSGLCDVDDAAATMTCYYPRTDQSGTRIYIRWAGRYTVESDVLDVTVTSFTADSTDPDLRHLRYSRVVE